MRLLSLQLEKTELGHSQRARGGFLCYLFFLWIMTSPSANGSGLLVWWCHVSPIRPCSGHHCSGLGGQAEGDSLLCSIWTAVPLSSSFTHHFIDPLILRWLIMGLNFYISIITPSVMVWKPADRILRFKILRNLIVICTYTVDVECHSPMPTV